MFFSLPHSLHHYGEAAESEALAKHGTPWGQVSIKDASHRKMWLGFKLRSYWQWMPAVTRI